MTAGPHTQRQWPWPDLARWLACFTLALFVHVGGALALLAHWSERSDLVCLFQGEVLNLLGFLVNGELKI